MMSTSVPSNQSIEDKVSAGLSQILRGEALEEGFANLISHTAEGEKIKRDYNIDVCKQIWISLSQEFHDAALKLYAHAVYKQHNGRRTTLLLDLLENMVENSILSPKLICTALLNDESLDYKQEEKWCQTFKFVRTIIGGVDYKGCRDLLRVLLEKCQSIPAIENVSVLPQVEAVHNVIAYVLDRNACLLPSLFAVHEITKFCGDGLVWPHWKLGQLMSDFIYSFQPTAQMVTTTGRTSLLPVVGHSLATSNVWRLSPTDLKFTLSGLLPYKKELLEPQTSLLRYVLDQPYSRDMVCSMLGLNKQVKQRCVVLEDQLVDLVVQAMEKSEHDEASGDETGVSQLFWQHLSSQLIFFVLFQFASFPHMVLSLYDKLKGRNLRKGRDNLMWILLQFISGSIQKNPLADFLPVIKLYDILYLENEVLNAPDHSRSSSTHDMAITCIWIHLNKKAQSDTVRLPRHIPQTLNHHLEFLKQCRNNKNLSINDYRIALLCNAYSTNSEYFGNPMAVLMESIYGNGKTTTSLPGNIVAYQPTQPLPMSMLDSLTVHAKMSLIHNIVTRVIRAASVKSSIALAPGLVETYSRLLVYMEIESLGIKGFISQLLPTVVKSQAWGILHTLLEMFSYRLHHTQPHYRVQLLGHLHSLIGVPQTNQNQLHLRIESTALRLITGLGSSEVQPQLSRVMSEPKGPTFVSQESEELNRALVLTLARAMHVTGSESYSSGWCHDILVAIMQHTPHSWPSHTLACFPQGLADFFHEHPVPREDNNIVKTHIETEYNKWKSMVNENDIIAHFSMQGTAPYFYCILWKILLDEKKILPTAYKVLDRLGPHALSKHLRVFADFLVFEFSSVHGGSNVNRYIEGLNDLVWKYNVVTIDRLILCLAMRNLEGKEASVCYFVMQRVLFKPIEFRSRVNDFISENSPDHWLQNNWHEKHMIFHNSYPEKFFHDGIHDVSTPTHHQYLPVYFGNICLRFLPVLDIVIHRFLEIPQFVNAIDGLLDIIGGLYKFHDRPVTYLYNTLHYYEKNLASQALLKKKLVNSIIGALKDIRPANWCLTEDYQQYLQTQAKEAIWEPQQEYYIRLVTRLVDTMAGNSPFPNCDWRFNEFPNPASHALHATCIELMALPVASQTVGENLIDVVLVSNSLLPREKNLAWMNAIGLILTALPDSYWQVVYQRVLVILQSDTLTVPEGPNVDPFKLHQMFNFDMGHSAYAETECGYMLALCHAVWHHASIGQLGIIPRWLKDRVKGIVETEKQFVCLCYLVGPFLQRFHTERTRCLWELTVELYEILEKVDKLCEHLYYMDTISDFLYHIKYMYVGDGVKNEVEKVIRNLRPALQLRLRFISNITIEETKLG